MIVVARRVHSLTALEIKPRGRNPGFGHSGIVHMFGGCPARLKPGEHSRLRKSFPRAGSPPFPMRAFVVSNPGNDYHTRLGSCNWFDRRRDRDPNFRFVAIRIFSSPRPCSEPAFSIQYVPGQWATSPTRSVSSAPRRHQSSIDPLSSCPSSPSTFLRSFALVIANSIFDRAQAVPSRPTFFPA